MSKFCTIQKLADDVGIDPSSIRKLLNNGTLTKHYIEGMSRIFIDINEFDSKMSRGTGQKHNIDIDLEPYSIS